MEFNQESYILPPKRISYMTLYASAVRWRRGLTNPQNNIFQWRSDPKIIMNIMT